MVPLAQWSAAMVERGNLVAVEADVARPNMVAGVSRRAVVVPCVKIMAEVVVFNAPIRGVVPVRVCYPDRPCDTPDHPGGMYEN